MLQRPLGHTGLSVSPLGFGAFKIGRNQKVKYPQQYDLPDDKQTERLLNEVLDLGINLIDTAPAYGISEERVGKFLHHRRDEFVLSTKVGETFTIDPETGEGVSRYEFSADSITSSVERSLKRLRTDVLDLVLIHSDGRDMEIQQETDAVTTLQSLKDAGKIRAIGLSGKTVEGHRAALEWSDVLMVEYHADDTSQEMVMREALDRGVGIFVKKGLAAGRLEPKSAIEFVLKQSAVSSLIVGGLNPDHLRANVGYAHNSQRRHAA
ncbi:aldo/keto reductase [Calycomorphotria hydatis]|uniref:General stress protein 69 n=1 Tax=Calycomorphotria hydatis TaxID=2528027 RepID=A0A517T6K7_9PLAN|nr:aldo/keto reductase [Calycomorphotria hydatis]QDT64000.1 General stress protein 69 [Calycomorphotria hydatis]